MPSTESSNPPVVVRQARKQDVDTVLSLIAALADFEELPRPDEEARTRMTEHGFGAQPKFEVFLAEIEGKAVGYTISFETYSTFLARPTFYLEDLFVLPEYRKQKAGLALFKNCVRLARQRECGRMDWQVLDWNENAINFYDRLGAKRLKEWQPYRLGMDDLARLDG
ncbi:MAG: GCN5-related N-acetyltransferase [Chloroflexi bacterium]|jgi:GNAT superfamily N-acetyltransferase|nr:GCN5-related N-acetyltransferase [Chloroflexota bacterium]